MPPSSSTGMRRRSNTKRVQLDTHLGQLRPTILDEAVWAELETRLAPISRSYLRRLVIATGLPMSAAVEGVRQDSLQDAERTLLALSDDYVAGSSESRKKLRTAVIESKDRLRWTLNRSPDPDRQAMNEEILLWVMTWLENPQVFPAWLALRRRAEAAASEFPNGGSYSVVR
jgi:hypothetical protein